jgi:hypothetical protein
LKTSDVVGSSRLWSQFATPKDRGLLKLTKPPCSFLLAAVTVNAQQIKGEPRSPSATTTIDSSFKLFS